MQAAIGPFMSVTGLYLVCPAGEAALRIAELRELLTIAAPNSLPNRGCDGNR